MFETETFGPCLVWKLQEEGDRGVALPPGHPSGYAPKHRNRKIQKRRNLS